MSFDGFVKRKIYWINDFLHGSPIRSKYRYMRKVLSDETKGKIIQAEKLNDILTYAKENSQYYAQFTDAKGITDFPIVNKQVLNEVHELNEIPADKIPNQEGEVFIQRTSGSTGVPFAVPQDTDKRKWRIAELKYFNDLVGFKSHEKLGQCRIWTKWHSKSKWQIFKENIIPINIAKLDDSVMKDLVDTIKKHKIFALRAYASWYDTLVDYLESGKGKIEDLKSLKVCISISEGLNPAARKKMKELTGLFIVEVYSDEEMGTFGQQLIEDTNYYLNHANYYFELLKLDTDEPAEYGELGRLVITDLHNHAFPMIRYDTGDTAVFEKGNEKSHGWPYMSKLYGRIMDLVYSTKGEPLHPMNFGRVLKNFKTITQWQFIQTDEKKYTIKLNVTNESELDKIQSELKSIVGEDADITVQLVNEIPVLRSGKRKPVLNEWKR